MSTESNREPEVVTCNTCGKTNGEGRIGTHWICEDCKVDPNGERAGESNE